MLNSAFRHVTRLCIGLLAVGVGLFVLGAPCAALADDNVAIFAGGQIDFSNYVFAGANIALPGSTIGSGMAVRALVDTGGYDYVSGLQTIKANFGGGELDFVYQLTNKNFWSDFGAGVNDTYTEFTPNDPTNPLRGDQVEPRLNVDGGALSGPWRADWFGYYGTRLQDYEAMLGGTHSVSSIWRVGLEGYGEGNPSYRLGEVGPYAGLGFGKNSEFQLSTGEAWESGFPHPRLYVRAMIYQRL